MSSSNTATVPNNHQRTASSIYVRNLCLSAVFMAMNVALSSVSMPVPGGHLYLNDIVIVAAAVLLNPVQAFLVGGFGAFLGDLFFYPAPMFVSLATHGLQAVVISLITHKAAREHRERASIIGAIIGAIIMVIGYTLGRAFVYSTPEYSIIKLPFEILQAGVGVVVGLILVWRCGLMKLYERFIQE